MNLTIMTDFLDIKDKPHDVSRTVVQMLEFETTVWYFIFVVADVPTLEVPEASQNQRLNIAAQWKPEVTFSGFPRPEITWEKNGQSIVSDSKCKIFVDEKTTTIAIYSLERSDTATYIVRAANAAGSACAQLSLTVIG